MGQQVPDFGGDGLLQATEQMVSLQLSRPPDSQVHVVQLFGCQADPSGCVSFKWSMHEARQRHICKKKSISAETIVRSLPSRQVLGVQLFAFSFSSSHETVRENWSLRGSRACSSCNRSCTSSCIRGAADSLQWVACTRKRCSRSRP